MRGFLKSLAIKILIAFLVVLLLAFFIRTQETAAQQIIINEQNRLQAASQNIVAAQNIFNLAPAPRKMPLQDQPAARDFANRLIEKSNSFVPVMAGLPVAKLPKIDRWHPNNRVRQTQQLITNRSLQEKYKQINQALSKADELLAYNSSVFGDLAQLFDYNPAEDLNNLPKDNPDISSLVNTTGDGLQKVYSSLADTQGKYKDQQFIELLGEIKSLQANLSQLQKTGDKNLWISQVADTQKQIILNRSEFWRDESSSVQQQLITAQVNLAKIQKDWGF